MSFIISQKNASNTTVNNILLCGYLREHEINFHCRVPQLVQHVINKYCKQYVTYQMGDISDSGGITSNIQPQTPLVGNELDENISRSIMSLSKPTSSQNIIEIMSKQFIHSHLFVQSIFNKLHETISSIKSKVDMELISSNKNSIKVVDSKNSVTFGMYIDKTFLSDTDTIINIEFGTDHVLFLTQFGFVYSCGVNSSGQCGLPNEQYTDYIKSPTLIKFNNNDKIKQIAAGKLHSLFINDKNELLVCGYNYCGQLGIEMEMEVERERRDIFQQKLDDIARDSDDNNTLSPISDSDESEFGPMVMLSSDDEDEDDEGDEHYDVTTFDYNHGEENIGVDDEDSQSLCIFRPVINQYFQNRHIKINKIGCGLFHSVCVTIDGNVYTFGHNGFGNLGNNQLTPWGQGQWEPNKLQIKDKIIDASCGFNHNLLLTEKHKIYSFGDNSKQQCSKIEFDENVITLPLKLSKEHEFGIDDNCFIEKIHCSRNESLIIVDPYKRFKN